MTTYRVLGPVEVRDGERRLALGGPRQVALLAFLLLHANRPVASERIVDALWGEAPERSLKRLQMAVARLRKALEPLGGVLRTVSGGYVLAVRPGELDVELFERYVEDGRRALEGGRPRHAAEQLRAGLELWRGQPFADVLYAPALEGRDAELGELRERWRNAAQGHGGAVAITGPRGIGKSRLIAEVHAEGAPVLFLRARGACRRARRAARRRPVARHRRPVRQRQVVGTARGPAARAGGERRRVALRELESEHVVGRLADQRLLTVCEGTAEVAHEAVLREWPRLRAWLAEDAEGRRVHRQLADAARTWDAGGRAGDDLYRGSRLAGTLDWRGAHRDELNRTELAFVAASEAAATRSRRRFQAGIIVLAGLLAIAAVAGLIARQQRGEAVREARTSEAQRLGAQGLGEGALDRALLYAAQGVAIEDSAVTRSQLLRVLLRSPAALRVYRGDSDQLTAVDVAPDGSFLALGDRQGNIRFLDPAGRRSRRAFVRDGHAPRHGVGRRPRTALGPAPARVAPARVHRRARAHPRGVGRRPPEPRLRAHLPSVRGLGLARSLYQSCVLRRVRPSATPNSSATRPAAPATRTSMPLEGADVAAGGRTSRRRVVGLGVGEGVPTAASALAATTAGVGVG